MEVNIVLETLVSVSVNYTSHLSRRPISLNLHFIRCETLNFHTHTTVDVRCAGTRSSVSRQLAATTRLHKSRVALAICNLQYLLASQSDTILILLKSFVKNTAPPTSHVRDSYIFSRKQCFVI